MHRHATRTKQRAQPAAPEPSAPAEGNSEAAEVVALQTALQELLDGVDAWEADLADAPAEDAAEASEAAGPQSSHVGDGAVRPCASLSSCGCRGGLGHQARLRAWLACGLAHWGTWMSRSRLGRANAVRG